MDATTEIPDTSMGLMKALHYLTRSDRRPVTQKYSYEAAGSAVHAGHGITREQRAEMIDLVRQLRKLDPEAESDNALIKELLAQLSKLPVRFIPVKRRIKIERSKTYPYRSKKRGG